MRPNDICDIASAQIGDTIITRSGAACLVTHKDHSTIHATYPGQRYGIWWSLAKPCVTGMPHNDPVSINRKTTA